jgi:hypothetical protein
MIPENDHVVVIEFLRNLLAKYGQQQAQIKHLDAFVYAVSQVEMHDNQVGALIAMTLKHFDVTHWEPPDPNLARPGLVLDHALSA